MKDIVERLGFMQGRLSPPVDGRIQAFPWRNWRSEFDVARRIGLPLMEWTLDQERILENPLMTPAGREEIAAICGATGVAIPSLTADFIMQAPFYKATASERSERLDILQAVIDACACLSIRLIVIPLVDDGRIEGEREASALREGLERVLATLEAERIVLAFESDFSPMRLAKFIAKFPAGQFGINYDMGNSASLGFDPGREIDAYGPRIVNVHIKDRLRGGTTVPLGTGSADLPQVFRLLRDCGYDRNFILQTARAADADHAGALARYRAQATFWWSKGA